MHVSKEDETGMTIKYVSINTEHHILLRIIHIIVPIEPHKWNIDKHNYDLITALSHDWFWIKF